LSGEAPEAERSVDLANIPDDDSVFRRLSDATRAMVSIDALTGERRPTSGAFKPDPDVSVYRESVLERARLGPRDLVRNASNVVVSVSVGDVRAIVPLDIRDDPWPRDIADPDHPRNVAHALIVGWEGLGKGDRIRRQRAIAMAPSLRFVSLDGAPTSVVSPTHE
jgi:hypothetical protein